MFRYSCIGEFLLLLLLLFMKNAYCHLFDTKQVAQTRIEHVFIYRDCKKKKETILLHLKSLKKPLSSLVLVAVSSNIKSV